MKKARIESDEEKAFKELASTLPSILTVSKLVNEGGFLNFDQVLYHSFISRVSFTSIFCDKHLFRSLAELKRMSGKIVG